MNYISLLTIKNQYDFLESLITIDQYIEFIKKNKLNYAFYSETHTMYGVAEFFKKATDNNIKPIIGLTIEFEDSTKLIIYAKNKKGYQILNFVSSFLNDGFNHYDYEIKEYILELVNNNVVVVGLINDLDFKSYLINKLNNDFYDVKELNLYFNQISYLDINDQKTYNILNAIKTNKTINQIQNINNYFYPDIDYLIKNYSLENIKKVISEINSKVDFNLFDSNQKHLVKYKNINNLSSYEYLRQVCLLSLKKYQQKIKPNLDLKLYINRLNYELEIIKQMGFSDYFLIVSDYVNFAKKNDILVGPGRGSAAGSLISYLLRITDIDPLEYDLLFERFLNPDRSNLPDIDLDFQDNRREEVLEYLFEKYGKYHVGMITTYQTIGYKMAWRDVCRVFNIDLLIVNKISKVLDQYTNSDFLEFIKENKLLNDYFQNDLFKEIFITMHKIIGLPRQTSTHAAGIVLTDCDLRELVPIKIGFNGINQTQFDMNYLDALGLIKMDILGLRNLTTIQEIKHLIYLNQNLKISLNKIDLNDKKAFELLKNKQTSGIFQLESKGMSDLISKMQVDSIEQISIASALYRPGPQEMIPIYLENKKTNKFKIIDKSVYEILKPTYGIIVYQEQVMQMLNKVANFSYAKADIIRRAMSKKNNKVMQSMKLEFINSAIKNNFSYNKANLIWNWIEKFSNYGFNKSHSISYSYISYWLAYFKAHFTTEFYTSLLDQNIGNEIKTQQYIKELYDYKIKVNKPSVINSNFNYQIINKQIYMPLTCIKSIGYEVVKKINLAKSENENMYLDIHNFILAMIKQKINVNVLQTLIKAGALDIFNYNKKTMIENLDLLISQANAYKQVNNILDDEKINLIIYDEYEDEILASFEKELYGFFIDQNPILKLKTNNFNLNLIDISKLEYNKVQVILGYILKIKEIKDKNNNKMAFVTVFDNTSELELTIFSSDYKDISDQLIENKAYVFKVLKTKTNNKTSIKFISLIKAI
ncbi:DNA polymerase III, alpha subunit subfamily, putative [synthetic Mycoplasma mycoides JCVI-syn1.0]|uniref:DNA-directed DNA polymerase n=1 Tax=Mycoplasma mycoides subsp. capri TaxID=40477 RepID=A0AB38GHA3_MYCMC|nr:DNA polymerase III subunit alpha [Mycoplasma mycoides]ADH22084.1 DNA polymerase III, alpha subunit subfamily, putative [synthetic Mycoplasma mycoides JCVI-syn1.0]AMW76575.1 DnaE: DNA polymerase III subunit alpha [synthetic bacterium JCVI-Syn3.0]AMW77047.1 DnaE: DNA polymerase III subunit alpha [synthetic bacterium JCVI-Syn2.0]AVX54874.1 DNA polymerase III subunit alpha [synthetic bacterium JCVI-Syn3A]QWN46112.1 DNA polymerase III subunit alpha [synthetic bacterium JCVI-Syn3B]